MHRFKKFSRGGMPPNPPNKPNTPSEAMRSMSLRDMQIPKSEKKNFLAPPLPNPGDAPVFICQINHYHTIIPYTSVYSKRAGKIVSFYLKMTIF